MSNSRAKDTKFLKAVDLYWHIKNFMGKILLDSEEDKEEILEQLAAVRQELQDIQARLIIQDHHEEDQQANSPRLLDQSLHERVRGPSPH